MYDELGAWAIALGIILFVCSVVGLLIFAFS